MKNFSKASHTLHSQTQTASMTEMSCWCPHKRSSGGKQRGCMWSLHTRAVVCGVEAPELQEKQEQRQYLIFA